MFEIPSYHLAPVRMTIIKNTNDSLCWRGYGARGNTLPLLDGVQTCTATLEISVAVSQKIGNQSIS